MKMLEIGRNIDKFMYDIDNTTRCMNFTRVKRNSKCMQILREMILRPRALTQLEIKRRVYKHNMGKSCHGFFSALHHFDLANFIRLGRKCVWMPTCKGIKFYMNLPA